MEIRARGGLIVLVVLALAAPAQGSWLQTGYDAARTGATPDAGPATDDLAWSVHLDGSRLTVPLVLGGNAYVLTGDDGFEGLRTGGVWRLDLDHPAPELFLPLDDPAEVLGTDGKLLFVALRSGTLEAYDLASGARAWQWPFPHQLAVTLFYYCSEPALAEGVMYLACGESGFRAPGEPDCESVAFAAAVAAGSGEGKWFWTPGLSRESGPGGIAALGNVVVVGYGTLAGTDLDDCLGNRPGPSVYLNNYLFTGLGAADGAERWTRNGTPLAQFSDFPAEAQPVLGAALGALPRTPYGASNLPVGTPTELYVRLDRQLLALNTAQGTTTWQAPLGAEDPQADDSGSGLALDGTAVYATSLQSIYRFNTVSHANDWRVTLTNTTVFTGFGTSGLAVAGGVVYGRTAESDQTGSSEGYGNTIHAFDADTGALRWSHVLDSQTGLVFSKKFEFCVSDGLVIAAGEDGWVYALGNTAASLQPVARADTEYPAPGQPLRVDLAGTQAGIAGPASMYRAEWGDGNGTEWQASPVLTHTYAHAADYRARFQARNDANQTASTFVTFHVGTPAPVELSPVQRAFAPENQNLTLFGLGIAATGVAALPGIIRLRKRRTRLQQELAALDAVYQQTRSRPQECEAALGERRARVRGLVLDGKLDEAQGAMLRERLDELGRTLRLGTLDARFDFLPHGMVKTLRDMLEDGKISAWEHRHFAEALERDTLLTAEQKAQVRSLIDAWFERDAGRSEGRG
jgi:outer membrane protein assembly factor BamB